MAPMIAIGNCRIGIDHPVLNVAELSANHAGSLPHALRTMEAAARSGASMIKLQTYTPSTMTIDCDRSDFIIKGGPWDGERLYDLYKRAHTPWHWHQALFEKGKELGVPVFSTPFDETAVELLEELKTPAYKIASFELIDLPLIRCVAAKHKPTIISTGMASLSEIDEAVEAFYSAGGRELVLLHCISGYPTPVEQSNLRRIPELARRFGCPVGLSDHTIGNETAIAAVALGACMIEKHFILHRSDGGPDAAFSIEPEEFSSLVRSVRAAQAALGNGSDNRAQVEKSSLTFRRSIYAVSDIGKGEFFTRDNVRVIRPGYGLAPKHYEEILGRIATCAVKRGTAITAELVGELTCREQ